MQEFKEYYDLNDEDIKKIADKINEYSKTEEKENINEIKENNIENIDESKSNDEFNDNLNINQINNSTNSNSNI